jgi:hypothetical protein
MRFVGSSETGDVKKTTAAQNDEVSFQQDDANSFDGQLR